VSRRHLAAMRIEPDHLDANEAAAIGQCGSLWLDSRSSAYLERSAKPCVASCRQMMAPHMAPSDTGGGTVSRYTRVPDWPSPRRVTVPGCQGLSGAPCRLGAVEDRAGSVRGCARIDLVCAHALACTDGAGGCAELDDMHRAALS